MEIQLMLTCSSSALDFFIVCFNGFPLLADLMQCETLVEDYEEQVLLAFRKSEENILQHLCVETMSKYY